MIANKDETLSETQGAEARRKSNLRCLVDNAIVEASSCEDRVVDSQGCRRHHLRSEQSLLKLSDACGCLLCRQRQVSKSSFDLEHGRSDKE